VYSPMQTQDAQDRASLLVSMDKEILKNLNNAQMRVIYEFLIVSKFILMSNPP
jgi:hypothetical protein